MALLDQYPFFDAFVTLAFCLFFAQLGFANVRAARPVTPVGLILLLLASLLIGFLWAFLVEFLLRRIGLAGPATIVADSWLEQGYDGPVMGIPFLFLSLALAPLAFLVDFRVRGAEEVSAALEASLPLSPITLQPLPGVFRSPVAASPPTSEGSAKGTGWPLVIPTRPSKLFPPSPPPRPATPPKPSRADYDPYSLTPSLEYQEFCRTFDLLFGKRSPSPITDKFADSPWLYLNDGPYMLPAPAYNYQEITPIHPLGGYQAAHFYPPPPLHQQFSTAAAAPAPAPAPVPTLFAPAPSVPAPPAPALSTPVPVAPVPVAPVPAAPAPFAPAPTAPAPTAPAPSAPTPSAPAPTAPAPSAPGSAAGQPALSTTSLASGTSFWDSLGTGPKFFSSAGGRKTAQQADSKRDAATGAHLNNRKSQPSSISGFKR